MRHKVLCSLTALGMACGLLACDAAEPQDTIDASGIVVGNSEYPLPDRGSVAVNWGSYVGEGDRHGQSPLSLVGESEGAAFTLSLLEGPPELSLYGDGIAVGTLLLFDADAELPDFLQSPEGRDADWTDPTIKEYLLGRSTDFAIIYVNDEGAAPDFPLGYSCANRDTTSDLGWRPSTCDDIAIETL